MTIRDSFGFLGTLRDVSLLVHLIKRFVLWNELQSTKLKTLKAEEFILGHFESPLV